MSSVGFPATSGSASRSRPISTDQRRTICSTWSTVPGTLQTSRIAFESAFLHARWVAVHAAQRGRLQHPGQQGNLTGKPHTESRLIEADKLTAEIAERVSRSKKNESAYPVRMARGKHHGDGAAVRVGSNVGLSQAKGIHAGGNTIGGGCEAGIETGNTLRLAHIEEVDGIDGGVACEEADVLTPVSGRANQSVQQQQRTPTTGALVVNLLAIHQHKSFFDICMPRSHRRRRPG